MHNLALHQEIYSDPELDALLKHKLLGFDVVGGKGKVHFHVFPALDHQGESFDDDLPGVLVVDDDGATSSCRGTFFKVIDKKQVLL